MALGGRKGRNFKRSKRRRKKPDLKKIVDDKGIHYANNYIYLPMINPLPLYSFTVALLLIALLLTAI